MEIYQKKTNWRVRGTLNGIRLLFPHLDKNVFPQDTVEGSTFAFYSKYLNSFLDWIWRFLSSICIKNKRSIEVAWNNMYRYFEEGFVGKKGNATIPKCNMGYDQRPSWHCSWRTCFCCFPLALANVYPWPSCHTFKFLWRTVNSKLPKIPFGIVTCTFSDNLSRNSCMSIFSPPVVFVVAVRSVYVARGAYLRPWLPHDTIIVISSLARSNNQKIPHGFKTSPMLICVSFCWIRRFKETRG